MWREPAPGLTLAPLPSPPLTLCPALWKTSHIPQTSRSSIPQQTASPWALLGLGMHQWWHGLPSGRLASGRGHWALGHLVRELYDPRYLECGLEGDETQISSGHTAWALCTLHSEEWSIAKGGPKWGLLSHGSQSWSPSYRIRELPILDSRSENFSWPKENYMT